MLRLYDFADSGNGYKARLLLALLKRAYDYVEVDILAGESRTPEFLASNPNGRIPVLELEDGGFLPESNAILFYLADGTRYWPDRRLEQAQVLQWLFFEQYSHEPNIATARFWLRHSPMTDQRRAALIQKQGLGHGALGVMEQHLAQRDFFVADRYSIADIALYAYTHVADQGGFDLGPYRRIRAWLDRIAAEPGHVPMTGA